MRKKYHVKALDDALSYLAVRRSFQAGKALTYRQALELLQNAIEIAAKGFDEAFEPALVNPELEGLTDEIAQTRDALYDRFAYRFSVSMREFGFELSLDPGPHGLPVNRGVNEKTALFRPFPWDQEPIVSDS